MKNNMCIIKFNEIYNLNEEINKKIEIKNDEIENNNEPENEKAKENEIKNDVIKKNNGKNEIKKDSNKCFRYFFEDLNDLIKKYQNIIDIITESEKFFAFITNKCELILSIKPKKEEKHDKDEMNNLMNEKEKNEKQNTVKKNSDDNCGNFLKNNILSYKENESKKDTSFKKRTQSQKNNDLKFNNFANNKKEISNIKNKISNSLQKIKEENEDKKPKGLVNLGLNCNMNSLIQCLFYIKELREYFIKNKEKFGEKQKICKAFAEIMNELKNGEKDYANSKKLIKLLGEANSLFSDYKAADEKDLFFNLIDIFLSELDKNKNNSNVESYNSEINYYNNKKQIFEETLKEVEQNKNIINELLVGFYKIMYYCKKNRKMIYSFQTNSFIIFELEKIEKYFETNKLSLQFCFDYYCREVENSSFYCKRCKETHNGSEYQRIYRPPKILIIILDRGNGKAFQGEVEINKQLRLKNIIDEEKYEYSDIYDLICVSTHEGESSSKGHYTACCKTDNDKYYYFSDTYVEEINEESLCHDEPYLLFYRQSDINKDSSTDENTNKKDESSSIVTNPHVNLSFHRYKNSTSPINSDDIAKAFQLFKSQPSNKYKIEYFDENYQNILYWKLTINGPKDSLYEGGNFIFKVDLSKPINYLSDVITIQCQFYHLNFGEKESGLKFHVDYNHSINLYNNLKRLFNLIYELLKKPDPELSKEYYPKRKLKEFLYNRKEYNKKAEESILYMIK